MTAEACNGNGNGKKWLAHYAAGGGLAIAISWLLVQTMVSEGSATRSFFQEQYKASQDERKAAQDSLIVVVKETTKATAQAASAQSEAAQAMRDMTDSIEGLGDRLERMEKKSP